MTRARSALDFGLRLAFFAAAPVAIVKAASLFPVGAAVVQIAIAIGVFCAGEAARGLAERSGLARRLLRKQLELEAFYRENPPRPFLYYVFYPLLLPYALWNKSARRELLLFRGFTVLSFVLLAVSLAREYVRRFPPELGPHEFFPLAAGTFAVETLVVLAFVVPMATSVVHFHRENAPKRLGVLLFVATVSMGLSVYRITNKRDPLVSYTTKQRVRFRTAMAPRFAKEAQTRALRVAWKVLPHTADDIESDGKVEGFPLEMARAALEPFYKSDEAEAFDLWYTQAKVGGKREKTLVLFLAATRGKEAMWLSIDTSEKVTNDPKRLPQGAFKAMWRAASR